MKIKTVAHNNRKKAFEVTVGNKTLLLPYVKVMPRPSISNPVDHTIVDKELGREGFTYTLRSGQEGTVHVEQVLEYNRDPHYLRDALIYQMTIEAQRRVAESQLSNREIIRRLGTSAAQFYRLLDQTNTRKSIGQLISLLQVLDCEVDLVVKAAVAR